MQLFLQTYRREIRKGRIMRTSLVRILLAAISVCFVGCQAGETKAADVNNPEMYAHFINVGQADSTLLEFPCGAVLIDAGAQDEQYAGKLKTYLDNFFARRTDLNNTLESVIITHNHIDHTSALQTVCDNFTVKRYIDNGNTEGQGAKNARWVRNNASSKNILVREITNDQVTAGDNKKGITDSVIDPVECNNCDPKITVLWARLTDNPGWAHGEFDNQNNQSIVIRVDFGEASFLFTGDSEECATDAMLSYYKADSNEGAEEQPGLFDTDVYHAGHHGSQNGTTSKLLEAVTPEIAVISVGQWNYGMGTENHFTTWHYGHPRKDTVDLLGVAITKKRSQPITIKAALGARDFVNYDLKKKIYTTATDENIKIRAKLDGTFIVTRNN
jgi:competence protein ComEC